MAGYVMKPVLASELRGTLQAVVETEQRSSSAASSGEPSKSAGDTVLNVRSLLERMGGSCELLSELIEVFFEDKEMMMTDLRAGLSRSDPVAVRRASTSSKALSKTSGPKRLLGRRSDSRMAARSARRRKPIPHWSARWRGSSQSWLPLKRRKDKGQRRASAAR